MPTSATTRPPSASRCATSSSPSRTRPTRPRRRTRGPRRSRCGRTSAAHARAKALEVRALALDGHDFGALAEQFSEGPGARKGGELGTFGRGEMEHDLEQAAFALEPGRVSEPVRASGGFHLLRVDERVGAGHKPLDEVQDEIRDTLYNQALEERFREWLSRDLRERHHVEVLD